MEYSVKYQNLKIAKISLDLGQKRDSLGGFWSSRAGEGTFKQSHFASTGKRLNSRALGELCKSILPRRTCIFRVKPHF